MSSVDSFTHQAYYHLLSYNLFYPSEKELRPIEAKGSIKKSIRNNNELFNGKDINSRIHTAGKPFRAVARAISLFAISTFIAPLGVLWNGVQVIKYVVKYYREHDSTFYRNEYGQKIKEYIPAFFADLFCTALAWGAVYCYSKKPWQDLTAKQVFSPFAKDRNPIKDKQLQGLLAPSILFFSGGALPKQAIVYTVLDEDKKAAVFKAMSLRNDFGIVTSTKDFLPYDLEDDNETLFTDESRPSEIGHFQYIRVEQAQQILWWIQHTQEQLPQHFQMAPHYPPSSAKILAHLEEAKNKKFLSEENYTTLSQKIRNLFQNLQKINDLFYECLDIKHTGPDGGKFRLQQTFFPMKEEYSRRFFNPEVSYSGDESSSTNQPRFKEETMLEKLLNELYDPTKTSLLPEENTEIPEQYRVLYSSIKQALNAKTPPNEAYKILGLTQMPRTEKELRTQYKACALATHPDKSSSDKFKKESEALFKCVREVFDYICKKKKWL